MKKPCLILPCKRMTNLKTVAGEICGIVEGTFESLTSAIKDDLLLKKKLGVTINGIERCHRLNKQLKVTFVKTVLYWRRVSSLRGLQFQRMLLPVLGKQEKNTVEKCNTRENHGFQVRNFFAKSSLYLIISAWAAFCMVGTRPRASDVEFLKVTNGPQNKSKYTETIYFKQ